MYVPVRVHVAKRVNVCMYAPEAAVLASGPRCSGDLKSGEGAAGGDTLCS